jgi:hypothetical protein
MEDKDSKRIHKEDQSLATLVRMVTRLSTKWKGMKTTLGLTQAVRAVQANISPPRETTGTVFSLHPRTPSALIWRKPSEQRERGMTR